MHMSKLNLLCIDECFQPEVYKCFIITIITKITWAIRHVLSADEKSTKAKEHITVDD